MDALNTAYLDAVRREIPRLLSWQDREPYSTTYGCFDRTYWGWKFTDFPGARYQEAVYALAALYKLGDARNKLAGRPQVLGWALAGMMFWQRLQHTDGSFDEAYPNERSLAATAFTAFYVGEALLLLEEHMPVELRSALRITLSRAADWLCHNDERHGVLSNHLAAAAAALLVVARISGDARHESRSRYFLQRIYDRQSSEGWYEEYGGADPGYQTHTTFYLARIWQQTACSRLLDSLSRSVAFLSHFIHPNDTIGGEYGSRNTEFCFPAGFEMLASNIPEAAAIRRVLRRSVADQACAGLGTMDAQNFLPMLNNYLYAISNAGVVEASPTVLPCEREGEWYFPDAGLLVKSTSNAFVVVGLSKGGVIKAFERPSGKLIVSDCGFLARISSNSVISSQSLRRRGTWKVTADDAIVEADFVQVNQTLQRSLRFVGFRLFTLSFGNLGRVTYWVKRLLVSVLISRRRVAPLRLIRRLRIDSQNLTIIDEIDLTAKMKLRSLRHGSKFSTVHMGSSRYFQYSELDNTPLSEQDWSDMIMRDGNVRVERSFSLG